ncbi:Uncharacterised protein [Vibrio cholerae]|nr:Uncharacterised protein [Vibrio cholerae]
MAHWRIRSTTIGTPNKMVNPHRLRLMKVWYFSALKVY